MNWIEWKKNYFRIIKQLGFDPKADERSAKLLTTYLTALSKTTKDAFHQKLQRILQFPVLIAGAGPSLEQDLASLFSTEILKKIQIIAVDGATTLFQSKNIIPTVVITDLDGDLCAIRWAIENGALTLIHAHGDNLQQISSFFKNQRKIFSKKNVWGTTQNKPGRVLFNFGGLTDGDRAIFLAFHYQSPLIGLIGFDFGTQIGKYSTFNSPVKKSISKKLEKFQVAQELIASFHSKHTGFRFNLTCQGERISGFPRVSLALFRKKLLNYMRR